MDGRKKTQKAMEKSWGEYDSRLLCQTVFPTFSMCHPAAQNCCAVAADHSCKALLVGTEPAHIHSGCKEQQAISQTLIVAECHLL